MKSVYPEEKGKITINGCQMEWVLRRSKGESCFGIRSSRIFELELKKDGKVTLEYGRGYSKQPDKEDEESALCLNYLLDKYGRSKKKEKQNG
jgi:hypothetical protein